MKGRDARGREIDLTGQQAEIVRAILAWHDEGKQAVLPAMGRGCGKTVIMCTVLHELRKAEESARPLVYVVTRHHASGYDQVHTATLPEGALQVTDCWQAILGNGGEVIGYACTKREATLDGEPVYYPRSAELAEKAGILPPVSPRWLRHDE